MNHPLHDPLNGATLVGVDDQRAYELSSTDTFIGRARENDVSLISDVSMSRRHAVISYADGFYYIRDLRSSNGTLVNGMVVDGLVALNPNDEIFVGRTRLLFCPTANKLATTTSYISEENTTFLRRARPTFKTHLNNVLLAAKRAMVPAANRPAAQPGSALNRVPANF